jgi:CubicO group peptidase (beta-lactamase class C family)
MRFLRFLLWLLVVLAMLVGLILITDNAYLLKGAWATYFHGTKTASIDDMRFYATRSVKATNPQAWEIAEGYNKKELSPRLRQTLESTGSVAFLIAKNDELIYEEYWDGYSDSSQSNSFSMAKSIISMLAQKAIEEGYIESWEDRVTKYLPEIEGPYRQDLKLRHLSTMTAGLEWNEHYSNPFDITARAYYGDDIEETMFENVPVVIEPGSEFEYQSGSPQLLGFVISRATGMSVSDYASRTLWREMGAVHDAAWHLDTDDGDELTYCCFNSNARDFARFGKLLINKGNWNGVQILDSAFISQASMGAAVDYYGWSFWILQDHPEHVYYMRGHLGQYTIVIPSRDLVVVRLGTSSEEQVDHHHKEFRVIVEEVLKEY